MEVKEQERIGQYIYGTSSFLVRLYNAVSKQEAREVLEEMAERAETLKKLLAE